MLWVIASTEKVVAGSPRDAAAVLAEEPTKVNPSRIGKGGSPGPAGPVGDTDKLSPAAVCPEALK